MTDWVARLQSTLHAEIPLTKAMGIEVVAYGDCQLTLKAPLQPNINHKSTAFGGSLYSIAVLTGWGLLFLFLQERGLTGQIVIAKSDIRYVRPVTGELASTCQLPEPDIYDRFLTLLQRKGKSRIELTAVVRDSNGQAAVEFHGVYVVLGN
ncbi:MAG: thioesterase domain-containing protein [Cyanobacteria bacterium P01_A01_bin.3]